MISILHVDDERDDFEITKHHLQRVSEDIHITWAASVESALEMMESKQFDCILSDYQMPDMSGLNLLNAIREKGLDTPFIFLTGQGNEELAAEALRTGADDYFTKEVGFAHYFRLYHSIRRVIEVYQDRRQKRIAERALKESEETYRNLVERASDAIVIVQDGKVKYANPHFLKLSGYSGNEILNQEAIRFLRHDERSKILNLHKLHLTSHKTPSTYETVMINNNGGEANVEVNAGSVTFQGKNATMLVVRDISMRKRTEQLKQEQYALLLSVLDGNPIPSFVIDRNHLVISWNRACEYLTGVSRDQVLGARPDARIFYPDGPEERPLLADIVLERDLTSFEKYYSGKNARPSELERGAYKAVDELQIAGEQRLISFLAAPIIDANGELIGAIETLHDITEQNIAQESLKESEQRLRAIFEGSRDAIFIVDRNARFVDVNDAAGKLTGYSREELESMSIPDLHEPGEMTAFKTSFERILAGEPLLSSAKILRKDGSKADVEFSNSAITIGDISYMHTTARDVSERMRMEEHLRRHSDQLARYAHHLEALNQELESFGYTVSHDLQAPLRHIQGFSKALLEDYGEKLEEQGSDFLKRIVGASNKMGQLIHDLLSLSRASRGDLNREDVNLSEIARSVVAGLGRNEQHRNVEFAIADSVATSGDKRLLHVVFDNLINNAWKFTSKNDQARIEFGQEGINGYATYYVRDNGVGFDSTKADTLFVPFQRLHSEEEFQGTGIGLATVQRIIHRHGGRIWAEAETGKGATFYFTLNAFEIN